MRDLSDGLLLAQPAAIRALRSELDHANNNVHRTRAAASAPPGRIRTLICLVDETQPPS